MAVDVGNLHVSGPEVSQFIIDALADASVSGPIGTAISDAITAALSTAESGPIHDAIIAAIAALKSSATVANVGATGVITPASVVYTQADQTALADAVLELKTKVNALLVALRATAVIGT